MRPKFVYNYSMTAMALTPAGFKIESIRIHVEDVVALLKFAQFLGVPAFITCHETGYVHTWREGRLWIT